MTLSLARIARWHRLWACTLLLVVTCLRAAWAEGLGGDEIYTDACATCHGKDGRGAPEGSAIGVPLPDFTDCITATSEPTANWEGIVRFGGSFLGLSSQMPAFGDVLSDEEILAVIRYVRAFCRDPRYPLGDLNFPRPIFIEKAYPEDEGVLSFDYESAAAERVAGWELAVETRLGARGQVEVNLPAALVDPAGGGSRGGVGDLGISYKYALLADEDWHSIVSACLALTLPTGQSGIGAGTTVVSPQLLAARAVGPFVLQTEIIAELPGDATRADRQMLYGAALQYRFGPYKKSIVTGLEIEQTQALDSDVHASTVLGPTLYLPLSRRGHIALGVGAQLPVAGTRPYDWMVGSFVLWDFADGPLWAW